MCNLLFALLLLEAFSISAGAKEKESEKEMGGEKNVCHDMKAARIYFTCMQFISNYPWRTLMTGTYSQWHVAAVLYRRVMLS